VSGPRLTFFCELEAAALTALFADPAVLDDLQALPAGVSLGLLDLSPERAAVVQRLNAARIPVTAWLLLPQAEGYWFNVDNAPQAAARYRAFQDWTAAYGLRWTGVGLDIEPDLRALQQLRRRPLSLIPQLLRRLVTRRRLAQAQQAYEQLVQQLRADGYTVESYLIPLILDERRAGATLLRRLAGLVDVPADREVLMLYTSFLGQAGAGVLWSYAREAQAIAVGSTGGGVELGELPTTCLSGEELARDLRLAYRWTDQLYIFSLEGCVRRGLLKSLRVLDWEAPLAPPWEATARIGRFRRALSATLWASAHPWLVAVMALAFYWCVRTLLSDEE